MADVDFEVINGMEVVQDMPEMTYPTEMQFDAAVPDGAIPVSSGGENIRQVPLFVRSTP
jgi:hypothetical protein